MFGQYGLLSGLKACLKSIYVIEKNIAIKNKKTSVHVQKWKYFETLFADTV